MSVREFGENLHRNTRTMSKESLLNLLQSRQNRLPILEDDADILGFLLDNQRDSHKNIMHIGIDGQLDAVERDTHYNTRGCTVYRPRYCTAYDILHDNSAAGGLTFPQTNRKFGGGVQTDGAGIINIQSDEFKIQEYTAAFWFKGVEGLSNAPLIILGTYNDQQAINLLIGYDRSNADTLDVHFDYANRENIHAQVGLDSNTWHHIVITAKDDDQRIYIDGVQVYRLRQATINITNDIMTFFGRREQANRVKAGTRMAWFSFCKGYADQTWVTNDYAGKRDFSDASPVEEITTLPFMGDLDPYPNAYDGMLYG